MAIFKHAWNFSSSPGGDWSEVHHNEAASLAASRANINVQMIDQRLSILHPVNTLDSIDIIPVHPGGAGQQIAVGRDGTAVAGTNGPANLGEAARITLNGQTAGRRFIWIRGMPEHFIERDLDTGKTKTLPAFKDLLHALITIWGGAGYGILLRTRKQPLDGIGQGVPNMVDEITYTAGGNTILDRTGTGTPPVLGDEVVLGGFDPRLFPRLNGIKTIVKVDNNLYHVKNKGVPANVVIPVSGGYFFKASYTVNRYNSDLKPVPVLCTRSTKNEDTGSRGARSARGGRG